MSLNLIYYIIFDLTDNTRSQRVIRSIRSKLANAAMHQISNQDPDFFSVHAQTMTQSIVTYAIVDFKGIVCLRMLFR